MKKNTLYFYYFKHLFFVLVIMTVVIVGLSLAFYSFFKSRDKQIEVPNIRGLSIIDAIESLQEKGLKPYIIPETSDSVPLFYVTTQQIQPKFLVKEGRDIVFTVSIGQNWLELPDFTDKNVYEVQSVMNALAKDKRKFFVRDIVWVESDKTIGTIVNQEPKKARLVDQATGVLFYVSNGEGKKTPSLAGKTLPETLFILGKENLRYKIFYRETDDASKAGSVIEQFPSAGSKITPEGIVSVTFSQYKDNKNEYYIVEYTVPEKLNSQKIKIVYRDNRGEKTLFEGTGFIGEKIIRVEQAFGHAKCNVYQFVNNKEQLFEEIKL